MSSLLGPLVRRLLSRQSLHILVLFALVWSGASRADALEVSPLVGDVHGNGRAALVVILHGGTSNDKPTDWSLKMARGLSNRMPNATYVGLLRPGYRDSAGRRSPGKRPDKDRHQYSKENNDLVAETLARLVQQLNPRRVILMGYSGGAAMAGTIAGRYPDLVNAVILVGCPCTRRAVYGNRNQVPMDHLARVAPDTRIVAITGELDDRTSPDYARTYIAAAKERGLNAQFIEVPGAGHSFRETAREFMRAFRSELQVR